MTNADTVGRDAQAIVALRSPEPSARLAALERLAADSRPLGEVLALAVLECLAAPSKTLQRRAADVLRLTGAAARPQILARLREACRAENSRLRWGATFALGRIGIVEPELVPPLLEALGQPDGDQRWAAAELMVACGRLHPDRVVPALLAALAGGGAELRKMVLYVLRDLAAGLPEVSDTLIGCLADPDVGVRLAALSGLCRLDPLPEGACELVLRMLREDPDPGLRRAAVSALGHVGHGVDAVRVVLDEAASSNDAGLRRAAAAARRRLGAERAPRD